MHRARIVATFTLLALAAGAASAEIFTVTLNNGNSFISRYQPQVSSWDDDTIILLTEYGNWMAVARDDVATVGSATETKGFGTVINTTTIALGWAPNDTPQPDDEAASADPRERILQLLEQQSAPREDYSVQQFAEPSEAGGIPVWMTGGGTAPIGSRGQDLSAAEPR